MVTQELKDKIVELCSLGLTKGIGEPKPGAMCGEAVVAYAMGESHGDTPSCVHPVDRAWFIVANDEFKGTNKERAELLTPVLLSQLGTSGKDRVKWVELLALGTVKRLLPIALRAAGLETQAVACEAVTTLAEAQTAASNARLAASDARYASYARLAASDVARYARLAANYARYARLAASNASYAASNVSNYASDAARYASDAASYASNAARLASYASHADSRNVWKVAVEAVLEAYEKESL